MDVRNNSWTEVDDACFQPPSLPLNAMPQVRKEWKVKGAVFGTIDGRVTYVLDKKGVVTSMYDNLLDGAAHSREALKALGV